MNVHNTCRTLILCILLFNRTFVKSTNDSHKSGSTVGGAHQSTTSLDESLLKLLTKDPSDDKKTKINDVSQYTITEKGNDVEYKFKDDSKLMEVKYNDQLVWKYDQIKHKEHPKLMYFIPDTKRVIVSLKDSLYAYRFEGNEWKSLFSGDSYESELDIKSKESDHKFTYSRDDSSKTTNFTTNLNYVFSLVKHSKGGLDLLSPDEIIWQTNDKNEYSTKVEVIDVGSKKTDLKIHMLNGKTKQLRKEKNTPWTELSQPTISKPRSTVVTSTPPSKPSTPGLQPSEHPKEIKLVTQDPSDDSKTKENDNSQYKVFKKDVRYDYKLNDDAKLVEIKYDDKLVWEYDKDKHKEYPKFVYLISDTKSILLSFKDSLYVYRLEDNEWKSVFGGNFRPIQFGINYKKSSNFVNYSKNYSTNTHTYNPKGNILFAALKESDKVIFEVKDKSEIANKVVLVEIDSNRKQLTVQMLSGHTKKFEKDNNEWSEVDDFSTPIPDLVTQVPTVSAESSTGVEQPIPGEKSEDSEIDETEGVEGEDETEILSTDQPTEVSEEDMPYDYDKPICEPEFEEETTTNQHTNIEFTFVKKFEIQYLYYIIPAVLGIVLLISLIIYK